MITFRFLLIMALLLPYVVPMAAQKNNPQPVDANGVKVVVLAPGDKVKNHLKGDDKKAIRKLVIDTDEDPDREILYQLNKTLPKFPNLESIDASNSKSISFLLQGWGNWYADHGLKNLKSIRVAGRFLESGSGEGLDNLKYVLDYAQIPLEHLNFFPNLTECTLTKVWDGSDYAQSDSLYVNKLYDNQYVMILLPKENGICFKKVSNPSALNCQVILERSGVYGDFKQESFEPANQNMEGAVFVDSRFMFKAKQQNLIVPASVKYIFCSDLNLNGSANNIEFVESSSPVHVYCNLPINNYAAFNRPVEIHKGGCIRDLDSITFKRSVLLEGSGIGNPCNLSRVQKVVFNDKTEIRAGGCGDDIKSVVFNAPAQLGTKAFGKVGTITFNVAPELEENYAAASNVYVPKGFKRNIPNSSSKMVYEIVSEKALEDMIAKTIEIQTPGSLLSVISPNELSEVENLTIIGLMNDADAKVLTELGTSISNLNLRDCIILDSEDTRGVKYCVIPGGFMRGNSALREIILPNTATYIESYGVLSDCPNLRKVTFPPYLESIGYSAFKNCLSLEEVVLPKTVRYVGERLSDEYDCFVNCPNLKRVIFNGSTLSYNICLFRGCKNLKEIRVPGYSNWSGGYDHRIGPSPLKGVKVYVSKNVTSFTGKYTDCEMYFESSKAPENSRLNLENCTIYCPKGAATSYFSVFGKNNKYVEASFPVMEQEKDEYALRYITNQKRLEKRLEETKSKKADAEWRKKYGANTEPCMQCYGTGIYTRKVGNNYHRQFCPYCNGSGVIRKK